MAKMRDYPVPRPSSVPGTGSLFYQHLMENLVVPASANHSLWYTGEAVKVTQPGKYAFRGKLPVGETIELHTLGGKTIPESERAKTTESGVLYTFDGSEGPVLVLDLAPSTRRKLDIPLDARDKDKVYNPNFVPYEQLDMYTKVSNELAALALPKSISSYFGGTGKVNYSELDVLRFLNACFEDLSSPQMMHVLHGNHMAWATLAYVRAEGNIAGDISAEFHRAQPPDFYAKDLGTVLPAMFYALALLGENPVEHYAKLGIEVWGAREAAEHMRQHMPK